MRFGSENYLISIRKNVAREFFRFGARIKNFWSHSEKNLAPFSQDLQTTIRAFSVRNSSKRQVLPHCNQRENIRSLTVHPYIRG